MSPGVLVPIAFGIVLLLGVLEIGDVHQVGQDIALFPRIQAALIFVLVASYICIRCGQWHFFLRFMKVSTTWRRSTVAFVGGEATESLPVGIYFANVLLQRATGVSVAQTAPATMVSILLEVACSCVYLVVVPIPPWRWLRPVIVGGLAIFGILLSIIVHLGWHVRLPQPAYRYHRWVRWLSVQTRMFQKGTRALASPRALLPGAGFSVVYLATIGGAYYVILRAVGVASVSYWDALAAYLFGLAAGLILPTPTEIGVAELTGLGALNALGVDLGHAATTVLLFRLMFIGFSMIFALLTFGVLHRDTAMIFRTVEEPRTAAPSI